MKANLSYIFFEKVSTIKNFLLHIITIVYVDITTDLTVNRVTTIDNSTAVVKAVDNSTTTIIIIMQFSSFLYLEKKSDFL